MKSTEIARLDKACRDLERCRSVDEAKGIRDQAEAVRAYCQKQRLGLESQNYAAEIKLRAERKCGELLTAMDLPGRGGGDTKSSNAMLLDKLSDLGIGRMQSHRWQLEASVPDEHFETYVRSTHEASRELTSGGLYKLGKKLAAAVAIDEPLLDNYPTEGRIVGDLSELSGEKFGCIYSDPPWKYGNQATRAATSDHYRTLSVDELCNWPLSDYAADDAHLHLWTTNAFLPDAFRVIAAWGFEYRSCFVWVKTQMGIGNYWRVSHEFLLLGIRGNAKRFHNRSLMSWAEFERGKHSSKPEEVRGFIEAASLGPYLELFGRKSVAGWTVLGNQVARMLV